MRAPEAHANKAIPIDGRTAEAITEQRRVFREKFGREPGLADPLFFNPESRISQRRSTGRNLKNSHAGSRGGLGGLLVIAFR
jgi:hypothetical protein